jgi:hypothetical protein
MKNKLVFTEDENLMNIIDDGINESGDDPDIPTDK